MTHLTRALQVALILLASAVLWLGCAATCCQCTRGSCAGCPERPGLMCTGGCGDSCFYCPIGNDCSCDAQCLGPPQPAPPPGSSRPPGASRCERLPRVGAGTPAPK